MELRDYQRESVSKVLEEWEEGRDKTLLVLPTGTGKTICMAEIARRCAQKGQRILVLAHRGELIYQAADKFQKAAYLETAIEMADQSALYSMSPVVVGSVQSLQGRRLEQYPPDYFDRILVDEAHHALATTYLNILRHFDKAKVLGVTATPDRGDRKNLGKLFESIAFEYLLKDAIKDGYLVPIKAQLIPLDIDLSAVRVSAGDYQAHDLDHALDPYLEQIAQEMQTYCKDRKTVVFLPLIETSKKFTRILNRLGFKAAEVNGGSDNRKEILEAFEQGWINVLCNSMLLTEGWDCPPVDCVICLRPTQSRALYSQMVGRGTRLSPQTGKKDLLILDFLWHTEKHRLCRPAHLTAKDDEQAKRITQKIAEADGALDLEEAQEMVVKDAIAEREESLKSRLAENHKKKRSLVDPLEYALAVMDEDLSDYQPTFAWEMELPSDKQMAYLEKQGFDLSSVQNKGHASKIMNRLIERQQAGLATPKQIRQLESRGFQKVGNWTFEDASKMMSTLASNGWRTPRYINPTTYIPDSMQPRRNPFAMN